MAHCVCLLKKFKGKPDAGNLHVRFDEGGSGCMCIPSSTLPRGKIFLNKLTAEQMGQRYKNRNIFMVIFFHFKSATPTHILTF